MYFGVIKRGPQYYVILSRWYIRITAYHVEECSYLFMSRLFKAIIIHCYSMPAMEEFIFIAINNFKSQQIDTCLGPRFFNSRSPTIQPSPTNHFFLSQMQKSRRESRLNSRVSTYWSTINTHVHTSWASGWSALSQELSRAYFPGLSIEKCKQNNKKTWQLTWLSYV